MPSAASVPIRFADCILEGYVPVTPSQREALEAARAVAAGQLRNLVLIGPAGVGKTHLAAAIVTDLHGRAMAAWHVDAEGDEPVRRLPDRPLWANVADLMVRMRLEIGRPRDDRDASALAIELASHRGYVVLDDLGRENTSDWTGETIYSLVNARYEAILPTIVTSNLTAEQLATGPYWPAISRLAQDGRLVKVEGPDHRLGATS